MLIKKLLVSYLSSLQLRSRESFSGFLSSDLKLTLKAQISGLTENDK